MVWFCSLADLQFCSCLKLLTHVLFCVDPQGFCDLCETVGQFLLYCSFLFEQFRIAGLASRLGSFVGGLAELLALQVFVVVALAGCFAASLVELVLHFGTAGLWCLICSLETWTGFGYVGLLAWFQLVFFVV